ncbi:hypothetical protein BFR04_08875 [Gaetbulibacter sp. 4G1]|nr:glycosyltransferase [Gaetbulibacter sp. 4G1]PIA77542.1 hypothetical protein BFR04_08875 [Gaetbulibacter sp. 4G1]
MISYPNEINKSKEGEHNQFPLISVIIITYNSSKYVLETLESIKIQTYKNIELIITDDYSTDNTIEICQNWLIKNNQRFINTELVITNQNTGIPSNCNRGLSKSKGEWLKFIAGDDVLDSTCIESYINYIFSSKISPSFIFSNQVFFKKNIQNIIKSVPISKLITKKYSHQYLDYLCDRPTIIPSAFVSHKILKDLGGFNESYRLLEDVPLLLKALQKGVEFNVLHKNLVYYRISEVSVSNDSKNESLGSNLFLDSIKAFYDSAIYPNLLKKGLLFNYIKAKTKFHFALTGNYPKNILPKIIYKLILKLAFLEKRVHLFFLK